MNVLLLCSQGMSTGMLCEKITQAAKEDGKELHIWAASEIKAREHVGKADLILLGPQIRYLQKRISEMAPGKPVEVIDMMAYGMMWVKKYIPTSKNIWRTDPMTITRKFWEQSCLGLFPIAVLQKVTIWKLLNVPNRETSNRLKQLLNAEMKTTCMPMKHILDYFRKKPVQKVDF